MIKLGTICPELQRLADEMTTDNAPADLGSLSPAEQRAELAARGLLDVEQERDAYKQRLKNRRQKARHYERRRARR